MLANRTIIADFSVIRGRCCSMVKMSIKNHITSHHKYVVRTRLWLVGGSYQQTRLLQLLVVCGFFFFVGLFIVYSKKLLAVIRDAAIQSNHTHTF